MIVETRYVEKAELTDEEVWFKYMLILGRNSNNSIEDDAIFADEFLEEFKLRFRKND